MSSTRTPPVGIAMLGVPRRRGGLARARRPPGKRRAAPGRRRRPSPPPEDRPADREAVRKALDGFVAAFQKGDAKAVAAGWTAEGEYISDDGTVFRGRPALEKAYAEFFTTNPGNAAGGRGRYDPVPVARHRRRRGALQAPHGEEQGTGRQPVQLPLRPGGREVADRHRPRVARRRAVPPRPGVADRHLGVEAGRDGRDHEVRVDHEQVVHPLPVLDHAGRQDEHRHADDRKDAVHRRTPHVDVRGRGRDRRLGLHPRREEVGSLRPRLHRRRAMCSPRRTS